MSDERLKDKTWRISHLYKIKDKQKKLVQFKLNRAQADFGENKHTRNIILKSRQLGFTTLEAIDTLDDVLFVPNFDALFIAQDLETAKDIFDNKIKLAWDNFALKEHYLPDLNSARKIKVELDKGYYSSVTVDSTGRSGTFSRLHVTEFDTLCKTFPDRAREVLEGSIPAIPNSGRVDIESTAVNSDGLFYDLFWEAWNRGEPKHATQFKSHFYNWQWDPDIKDMEPIKDIPREFLDYQKRYQLSDKEIAYYYLKFVSLGEAERNWATMRREYPTTPEEAFSGAGNKLFDLEILGLQKLRKPLKEINNIRIFKEYRLGHRYAMGCDVGEGIGQDASTMVLWDFTPAKPEVVAEYVNNRVAPDMFAYEIKNLAEKYEQPLVAVERNNHGHTTLSKLQEIYPLRHIYKDEKDRLGWQTNLVSKPKMMYDLNTATNEQLVDINSQRIVSEMRRYDKEDLRVVKYKDEIATQHWDLLVACAIGFQMKDHTIARAKRTRSAGTPARRGGGIYGV